jgi:tetratricopeptide (TPR) repeat protein
MQMSNKDESITALYENGELLMYKVSILAEAGDAERAIKVLEDSEANIVDKEAMRELKGQILAQLGRVADAEAVYRGLLKSNPENRAYYLALEKLVGPDNVLGRCWADARVCVQDSACPSMRPAFRDCYWDRRHAQTLGR